MPTTHMKYVDDMTMAESLNLRQELMPNPDTNLPRPLTYHERTQQVLPEGVSQLQEQLNTLVEYCQENEMMINAEKTKVMLFNTGRDYDFLPKLSISNGSVLEVVEECQLLGVKIRSDLKWSDNTDYLCKRAYARIWMMRRLKSLGADTNDMLDVFNKQIRSVLELAAPVWHPNITIHEEKQIERIQKTAFYVILGEEYVDYEHALASLSADRLSDRRSSICQTFVKRTIKHPKYGKWFSAGTEKQAPKPNTRAPEPKPPKFKPVPSRTDRYEKSSLPHLTRILNDE